MLEIMYSIQHQTYVTVYQINMEKEEVLFRNHAEHKWLRSPIRDMIPKKEWEDFLEFYDKWKDLKYKHYKSPKIHIGTQRGPLDSTIFFIANDYAVQNSVGIESFDIYKTYKEAEEALKLYIYEDYYCSLTEEQKKEILEEKEINYV